MNDSSNIINDAQQKQKKKYRRLSLAEREIKLQDELERVRSEIEKKEAAKAAREESIKRKARTHGLILLGLQMVQVLQSSSPEKIRFAIKSAAIDYHKKIKNEAVKYKAAALRNERKHKLQILIDVYKGTFV